VRFLGELFHGLLDLPRRAGSLVSACYLDVFSASRNDNPSTPEARSPTVRTLRALSERQPGNRYTLLLGADAARDLAEWWEVEALPELADIVVFARPGASVVRHPLIKRVIPVPMIDLSATQVRARVKEGRSIRYLVPDPVREYIAAHGLYLGA